MGTVSVYLATFDKPFTKMGNKDLKKKGEVKMDEIQHESGLVFEAPSYSDMNSLAGKRCFGNLLSRPQFTNLDGMKKLLPTLDYVAKTNVWVGEKLEQATKDENHLALISVKSNKIYNYCSLKYTPVQDEDVFRPLVEAAELSNLTPIGRFDGIGTGMTHGHVVFANPEFKIRLLEDYDDYIMLGLKVTNSYDKMSSVNIEVFGVRTVCVNYNLWGDLFSSILQKHVGIDRESLIHTIETALDEMVKKSPVVSRQIQKARDDLVIEADVPDLLWAINLPKRSIDEIISRPSYYCREMDALGLNKWTLYNAVTAYITWGKQRSGDQLNTTIRQTKEAVDLLTMAQSDLIKKGREKRLEAEEKEKEKEKVVA